MVAGRRVVVAKGAAEGVGGMGAMTAETAEREEGRGEVVVWVHCQAGAAAVRAAAVRVAARAVAGVGKRVATLAAAMASARVAVLEMCRTAKEKNKQDRCGCECVALRFLRLYLPTHGPVSWLMLETRN